VSSEKSTAPRALPPPTLVQDATGLDRLLEELRAFDEIAIDTEADSFFHYKERVCLIQVSAGDRDWLVDPLAGFDLTGLGEVLADPDRVKVFHDGEYDVLLLKRDHGWSFANLFDTRVAEAALGCKTPGLAAVLLERFGVELDKSLQRSDWSRRPLSAKQIDYARLDTRYLVPLMHEVLPELRERDRLRMVEGECRRLEALESPEREFEPNEFLRLKGARALSRQQMTCLRELFCMRDELARDRDLPPFKTPPNAILIETARALPGSPRQLSRVQGLSPKLAQRFGTKLLAAVARGRKEGPLSEVPRLPPRDGTGELDELDFELHERLKSWRRDRAAADDLDGSLILNRKTLIELARVRPRDEDALGRVDGIQPWQVQEFGAALLDLVQGFEDDVRTGRFQPKRRRSSRPGNGRGSGR